MSFSVFSLRLPTFDFVLHLKWRKQRKEQSHAQCHVTDRIRIFDKFILNMSKLQNRPFLLYQRVPLEILQSLDGWLDVNGESFYRGLEITKTTRLPQGYQKARDTQLRTKKTSKWFFSFFKRHKIG